MTTILALDTSTLTISAAVVTADGGVLATATGDPATYSGRVLALAIMFSLVNLLVDLSYAWINPKIRYA